MPRGGRRRSIVEHSKEGGDVLCLPGLWSSILVFALDNDYSTITEKEGGSVCEKGIGLLSLGQ